MVEIRDLVYRYDHQTSIQYPNWKVQSGEHALILGGSGSGKTTLLHLLAGLLKTQEGEISIGGESMHTLSGQKLDAFRGKNIGLIFQQPHLLKSLNVQDNLRLAQYTAGLSQDIQRIKSVLEDLNLGEKLKSKVYELSQGQQQRVAIARAVLNKPLVIMADEPTASLDDENADAVLDMLEKQATSNKASLIIATHDSRVKAKISKTLEL